MIELTSEQRREWFTSPARNMAFRGQRWSWDPATETASGLLRISYAFCPNVLTAGPAYIDSTIGMLSGQAMRKIEECLKSTLGIP